MLTRAELEAVCARVYRSLSPTPQYCWPLLRQRLGVEVWVKHENQTPIGAFKIRGGLEALTELREREPALRGVITATRGNHGQSVALAARQVGLTATIVVPCGNSPEKNAAMRALGAELVVEGHDFQAALEHARALAEERRLRIIPPFDLVLVRGVATYGHELLSGAPPLDAIYVPIGMGSGICGTILAREALGKTTPIIGVVSEHAPAYALSVAAGAPVCTESADTMADGIACRVPDPEALAIVSAHAERILTVADAEIEAAMRILFSDTHNVAEGAGAAALAGLIRERDVMAGKRVAVVLSGGNVDRDTYARVLSSHDAEALDGGAPG